MIARFDSLAHFVEQAQKHTRPEGSFGERFDLGVSGHEARRRTIEGDESIVAGIEGDMGDLAYGDASAVRWIDSVAGSRVNVPAYLAGNPACMRRRGPRTEGRSVRIFCSVIGNASVSGAKMRERGLAVLGSIQALLAAQVRVELYLVGDIHGHGPRPGMALPSWDLTRDTSCTIIVPIETRPLDLSTAGFALTHPAFFRHLIFGYGEACGFNGGYSRRFRKTIQNPVGGSYETRLAAYVQATRNALGLLPSDVFIPRVTDEDPLLSDPKRWIATRVHQPILSVLNPDEAAQ